jgi:hypothetical protein
MDIFDKLLEEARTKIDNTNSIINKQNEEYEKMKEKAEKGVNINTEKKGKNILIGLGIAAIAATGIFLYKKRG